MKKVLVIEDNRELSGILQKRLVLSGYEVEVLASGLDLVSRFREKEKCPDVVILDLMLPGRSGYDLLNAVKSVWPTTKLFEALDLREQ